MHFHALHLKAQNLAKTYLRSEKDLVLTLLEIDKQKYFRTWGFASLFQYVLSLGLSESQAYTLITVTRKSGEVPELKTAISDGAISISKAKRIVAIIDQANSQAWIQKAATMTCQALEREVVRENPQLKLRESIRPVMAERARLTLGISFEIETKLRRLQDVLSKKSRKSETLESTLALALEAALEKHDPVIKAKRLSPGRGCMAVRHVVNARDEGKCQARTHDGKICGLARFPEMHHRVPKYLGGTDSDANLITLCSGHHKVMHESLGALAKLRAKIASGVPPSQ